MKFAFFSWTFGCFPSAISKLLEKISFDKHFNPVNSKLNWNDNLAAIFEA